MNKPKTAEKSTANLDKKQHKTNQSRLKSRLKATILILYTLVIINTILLLATVGFGIKSYHDNHNQHITLTDKIEQLSQKQQKSNQQLQQLSQAVQNFQKKSQQQMLAQNKKQQSQLAMLTRLQKIQKQQPLYQSGNLWQTALIIQAWYLTTTAETKLRFDYSPASAIILLEKAKHNVSLVELQGSDELAQKIQIKINQLQKSTAIDEKKVIATLQTMIEHIQQLPLETAKKPVVKTNQKNNHGNRDWQLIIHKLKQWIKIYHHPMPSPNQPKWLTVSQPWVWRHYLINLCQQVKWALRQHQQTIYQKNLAQLYHDIDRSFLVSEAHKKQLLIMVSKLQAVNVAPSLPELTTTTTAILNFYQKATTQQALATKNQLPLEKNKGVL